MKAQNQNAPKWDQEFIKIKAPGFNMRALFNGSPTYKENRLKSESEIKSKFSFINNQGQFINHLNKIK